jgi:uncharacterized protein YdaU (DUF1376 family)
MNIWYAHYPGDYARDTAHLSLAQHGAYRLLLDDYYSTAAPLPSDVMALYRICRAFDQTEKDAVNSVLAAFFELCGDGYHNARADIELARQSEIRERFSDSGRRAAKERWAAHDSRATRQAMGNANGLDIAEPQSHPESQPYVTPIRERKASGD